MSKVKIFKNSHHDYLEMEMNKWLSENKIMIKHMQFLDSDHKYGRQYLCMVTYE